MSCIPNLKMRMARKEMISRKECESALARIYVEPLLSPQASMALQDTLITCAMIDECWGPSPSQSPGLVAS